MEDKVNSHKIDLPNQDIFVSIIWKKIPHDQEHVSIDFDLCFKSHFKKAKNINEIGDTSKHAHICN